MRDYNAFGQVSVYRVARGKEHTAQKQPRTHTLMIMTVSIFK